jgi:hypothetical protein
VVPKYDEAQCDEACINWSCGPELSMWLDISVKLVFFLPKVVPKYDEAQCE